MELYKYPPHAPGGSKFSFVIEYPYSFLATTWMALQARRSGRFAGIQVGNPPDIFWPFAMAFRALEGARSCLIIMICAQNFTDLASQLVRGCPTTACGSSTAGFIGPRAM